MTADQSKGRAMGGKTTAIIIHSNDNVATALRPISGGSRIDLKKQETAYRIVLREQIPMGHKFSLYLIRKCGSIIKYGEPIGLATVDIQAGCHVHTYNVESQRGRGDMKRPRRPR
jgi:altronate dehydratase small subunit